MITMKVVVGNPGTGKSTRLIQDAVDYILRGKSVFIMTPTNTAKDNLISSIGKEFENEKHSIKIDAPRMNALDIISKSIHVLYGYSGEDVILMDEIGMIGTEKLMEIRGVVGTRNIDIIGYGDIKQLPAIRTAGILEVLFRNTIKHDFWNKIRTVYEDGEIQALNAPEGWGINTSVGFEVLKKNYRLNKIGFDSYGPEYIDELANKTIDYSDCDKAYEDVLVDAIENYKLIIVPDHTTREREVYEILQRHYGVEEADKHMPFVTIDTKVYLNPNHINKSRIKDAYPFLKELPGKIKKVVYTASVVVDVTQGATVDDAIYYLGDSDIPNTHFYNYNRFFTAITRSRNMTQLVGKKSQFLKHYDTVPSTISYDRVMYHKAELAKIELFNKLNSEEIKETSFDKVYDFYVDIYNSLTSDSESKVFNISDEIYTKNELREKFKGYDVRRSSVDRISVDYRALFYEKNKTRNGRTKNMLKSMSNEEVDELRYDIENLTQKDFKIKYNREKKNVKRTLNNIKQAI